MIFDVNQQPNSLSIRWLVGRTSRNRCSVIHILVEIVTKTCHFVLICKYIFIRITLSGKEHVSFFVFFNISEHFPHIFISNKYASPDK